MNRRKNISETDIVSIMRHFHTKGGGGLAALKPFLF